MILVFGSILGLYCFLILIFAIVALCESRSKISQVQSSSASFKPKAEISVVIPYRNEAENLPQLLKSIARLKSPFTAYEFILVNDHSEDASLALVEAFAAKQTQVKSLNLEKGQTGKKSALAKGIDAAKHPWILSTDADCSFGATWLSSWQKAMEDEGAHLIAGPVLLKGDSSWASNFEILDFLGLQATTMAGMALQGKVKSFRPFLCNGANLAFRKSDYLKVDGYSGNTQIASGDDLFLMEKIGRGQPEGLRFLADSEAWVHTETQGRWTALVEQRVRWAAKTGALKNAFASFLALLVLLSNVVLVLALIFVLLDRLTWSFALRLFLLKALADFTLIFVAADFYKQKKRLWFFPLASLLYPLFGTTVGCIGLFGRYTWKGRRFRK